MAWLACPDVSVQVLTCWPSLKPVRAEASRAKTRPLVTGGAAFAGGLAAMSASVPAARARCFRLALILLRELPSFMVFWLGFWYFPFISFGVKAVE